MLELKEVYFTSKNKRKKFHSRMFSIFQIRPSLLTWLSSPWARQQLLQLFFLKKTSFLTDYLAWQELRVSILPTAYAHLFLCNEVVWLAFLILQFRLVLFGHLEIGGKAARKMLVKLTTKLGDKLNCFSINELRMKNIHIPSSSNKTRCRWKNELLLHICTLLPSKHTFTVCFTDLGNLNLPMVVWL